MDLQDFKGSFISKTGIHYYLTKEGKLFTKDLFGNYIEIKEFNNGNLSDRQRILSTFRHGKTDVINLGDYDET